MHFPGGKFARPTPPSQVPICHEAARLTGTGNQGIGMPYFLLLLESINNIIQSDIFEVQLEYLLNNTLFLNAKINIVRYTLHLITPLK